MSPARMKNNISAKKRRTFRGLTVALALLACLAGLEIVLRVWGPQYYRFSNNSREYFSNPRGYFDVLGKRGNQTVYGIAHRSEGDPLRRVPDPLLTDEEIETFLDKKNTILGLGDSFTFGQGVRFEGTYLRRLELLLADSGRPMGIGNAAQLGNDLEDICLNYEKMTRQQRYPLVIYGFVLNDFGLPGRRDIVGLDYIDINNGGNQYRPWRRWSATANFVCHHIEAIRLDRVTRTAYLEVFEGGTAEDGFRLLGKLNREINKNGGRLVIVLFPLFYDFDHYAFQGIHDKIADFCSRQDVPLLDLLPVFSEHEAEDLWVHAIDHHPNEIAHRIAADEVFRFLSRERLLDALTVEKPESLPLVP